MKSIVVIDNFYKSPEDVRNFALNCRWITSHNLPKKFPGTETEESFFNYEIVKKIESALGCSIDVKPEKNSFGVFARTSSKDKNKNIVHVDHTDWAGIIYLSDHQRGGTHFYKHKKTGFTIIPSKKELRELGFHDKNDFNEKVVKVDQENLKAWELSTKVGMRFNRMVLFRAGSVFHSAASYYGESLNSERLIQLFFFNEMRD